MQDRRARDLLGWFLLKLLSNCNFLEFWSSKLIEFVGDGGLLGPSGGLKTSILYRFSFDTVLATVRLEILCRWYPHRQRLLLSPSHEAEFSL